MNYNAMLQRTLEDRDTKFACYNLNKENEIVQQKQRFKEDSELINKYNEKKALFRNFGEEWTEDEIASVYLALVDKRGTKEEKMAIYQIAIALERTLFAIKWCVIHLWSEKELHRSNIMMEFRKKVGLA